MENIASFGIEGKSVLVAGAGGDIGREITAAFLREGCFVAAADIDLEKQHSALNVPEEHRSRLYCAGMDITTPGDVAAVIRKIMEMHGRLDIVVNSVGILCKKSFFDMTKEDLTNSFAVNAVGAFILCRQAAEIMRKQESGVLINIGSQNGITAVENRLAYSASKAALTMMTKTMALELGQYGITVNMVAPGIVDSNMARVRINTPEILAEYERHLPLGRLTLPGDVADSVLFLASPKARSITGVTLIVDCGLLLRQHLPK